jgi:hypothetical protein
MRYALMMLFFWFTFCALATADLGPFFQSPGDGNDWPAGTIASRDSCQAAAQTWSLGVVNSSHVAVPSAVRLGVVANASGSQGPVALTMAVVSAVSSLQSAVLLLRVDGAGAADASSATAERLDGATLGEFDVSGVATELLDVGGGKMDLLWLAVAGNGSATVQSAQLDSATARTLASAVSLETWQNPLPYQAVYAESDGAVVAANLTAAANGTASRVCGELQSWPSTMAPPATWGMYQKDGEPDLRRTAMLTSVCPEVPGSGFTFGSVLEVRTHPDRALVWAASVVPITTGLIFQTIFDSLVWVDPLYAEVVVVTEISSMRAWASAANISTEQLAAAGCPVDGDARMVLLIDGVLDAFVCALPTAFARAASVTYNDTHAVVHVVGLANDAAAAQTFAYERSIPRAGFVRGDAVTFGVPDHSTARLDAAAPGRPLAAGMVDWTMSSTSYHSLIVRDADGEGAPRRTLEVPAHPTNDRVDAIVAVDASTAALSLTYYRNFHDEEASINLLWWDESCSGGGGGDGGDGSDEIDNYDSSLWIILFVSLPVAGVCLGICCFVSTAVLVSALFVHVRSRSGYTSI